MQRNCTVETMPPKATPPLSIGDILTSINSCDQKARELRAKAIQLDVYLNGPRPTGPVFEGNAKDKAGVLPRMLDDLNEIFTILEDADRILDMATNALPDVARYAPPSGAANDLLEAQTMKAQR